MVRTELDIVLLLGFLRVNQFEIRVPRGAHRPSICQPCLVHVIQILTVGHVKNVVLFVVVAGIVFAVYRILAKKPVADKNFALFARSLN